MDDVSSGANGLSQTHFLTAIHNVSRASAIDALLYPRRPSAVAGFVVSVVIDAIQRVLF